MVYPVGLRFIPTEEEIFDHFLRLKHIGGSTTSHVDQVISTVNICNFDPWELPRQSRIESNDQVWYFFGRKEKRYNRGEQQIRKTRSGFWKKTGKTMNIKRKRGRSEKIGEKRVLVFHLSGSKTDWIMHEYDATSLSPNQNMTYTICKVQFKGEAGDSSSSATVGEIDAHGHPLITHMNMNSGGELSAGAEELQNSGQLSDFPAKQQETIPGGLETLSSSDWKYLFGDNYDNDDDELGGSNSVYANSLTSVPNWS